MADKSGSTTHEITYYLNVENAKILAFLMVTGFVVYHGFIHIKYSKYRGPIRSLGRVQAGFKVGGVDFLLLASSALSQTLKIDCVVQSFSQHFAPGRKSDTVSEALN